MPKAQGAEWVHITKNANVPTYEASEVHAKDAVEYTYMRRVTMLPGYVVCQAFKFASNGIRYLQYGIHKKSHRIVRFVTWRRAGAANTPNASNEPNEPNELNEPIETNASNAPNASNKVNAANASNAPNEPNALVLLPGYEETIATGPLHVRFASDADVLGWPQQAIVDETPTVEDVQSPGVIWPFKLINVGNDKTVVLCRLHVESEEHGYFDLHTLLFEFNRNADGQLSLTPVDDRKFPVSCPYSEYRLIPTPSELHQRAVLLTKNIEEF